MKFGTALKVSVAGASFLGLSALGAFAQSANFASFSGASFSFSNGTNVLTASGPVSFTFLQDAKGYTAGQTVSATLSFSAAGGAGSKIGKYDLEAFDIGTYTFTYGGKTLLSVTASSHFSGKDGGTSGVIDSDRSEGDTLSLSSDVWAFHTGNQSLEISLSSANPFGIKNGNLKTFVASGAGNFAANAAPVPEVGTLVGFGFIVAGAGAFGFRRTRKAAVKA